MNLTIKTETIKFGETKILGIFKKDIKFKVQADIPESMLDSYGKLVELNKQNVESDPKAQKQAFGVMREVIKGILYVKNKKSKVDKFVDKLGIQGASKIFTFLNEYINEVKDEKKNE